MAHLIEVKDAYKIYNPGENEVHALDGVSLTVDRGEFLMIVGHSGSGKSTLMNMLGLLDICTSGEYLIDGKDVSNLSDDELSEIRNKEIGFIFQGFNLIPSLTAKGNVELAADDVVKFLPGVGVRMDGQILLLGAVAVADEVRLRDLVAKARREVADLDAALLHHDLPLAAARDGVGRELRRPALQDRRGVNAEDDGAFMEEGEGEIAVAVFVGGVLLRRGVRPLGHLLDGEACDLAHIPDTFCDGGDGGIVCRCLHSQALFFSARCGKRRTVFGIFGCVENS